MPEQRFISLVRQRNPPAKGKGGADMAAPQARRLSGVPPPPALDQCVQGVRRL